MRTALARLLVCLAMLVGGGSAGPAAALAQAPDRSSPPEPGPVRPLDLPDIQKRTLGNGVPVWIVEQHEVPVAHVSLVLQSGASAEPAGAYGLASLTAAMLDEGAGDRSALEIADAVDFLGASLGSSSSFDASAVRLYVPVARLEAALAIMADIVMRPTFPAQELDRLREERLTSLLQARDNPASIAAVTFPRLVYGDEHRYGYPTVGTAEALRGFDVDDLKGFHAAHYVPANASLVVVGDVDADAVLPQLEAAFGTWSTAAKPPRPEMPTAPQLRERRVFLVDKPGAAQSQVRIGWIGVPRSTADYFPLLVLNTILGGSFSSRLNQNLREEHGYAYGAGSVFDMRAAAGPFFAAAGVQTDKTAEAIVEFFNELEGIHQPIPEEEFERVTDYLALSFPQGFETSSSIAAGLEEMIVYGLPENYFETYLERLSAVTREDVQRVAREYIDPDRFAVVVVGDLSAIEQKVRALDLGPVRVVSLDEVMN